MLSWAISAIRAWRLASYVEKVGELDSAGDIRTGLLRELRAWLSRTEKAAARIGLDPRSRTELSIDSVIAAREVAHLAERDRAEGERILEERIAELEDGD